MSPSSAVANRLRMKEAKMQPRAVWMPLHPLSLLCRPAGRHLNELIAACNLCRAFVGLPVASRSTFPLRWCREYPTGVAHKHPRGNPCAKYNNFITTHSVKRPPYWEHDAVHCTWHSWGQNIDTVETTQTLSLRRWNYKWKIWNAYLSYIYNVCVRCARVRVSARACVSVIGRWYLSRLACMIMCYHERLHRLLLRLIV